MKILRNTKAAFKNKQINFSFLFFNYTEQSSGRKEHQIESTVVSQRLSTEQTQTTLSNIRTKTVAILGNTNLPAEDLIKLENVSK